MRDATVIIPTYMNTAFIDECIASVCAALPGPDSEVLVGIDCCEATRSHVEAGEYDTRVRFFFFASNAGPYVVKNTLAEMAKHEDIIFFDSDDVMRPHMAQDMLAALESAQMARPMYIDFKDGDDHSQIQKTVTSQFAEGVFGVKRQLFLSMNGFEPWKCAADTEFKIRAGKNGVFAARTKTVCFFRRKHGGSLTKKKETSLFSDLRRQYRKMIDSKKYFGPLPELTTGEFTEIRTKGI